MITLEPPRRLPPSGDPWDGIEVSRTALMQFLRSARRAVALAGDVDVLLAGDATLRRLNREFLRKDKATDVLSFPAAPEIAAHHAGDLAISLQTALRQADAFGHTLDVEVRVLVLHGLLHLAGMDHETDQGEMASREAALRAKLRLPSGLIQRAMGSGRAVVSRKQILSEDDNQKSRGESKSTSKNKSGSDGKHKRRFTSAMKKMKRVTSSRTAERSAAIKHDGARRRS